MKKNIVICVSWPYANNNLHLGYIASSLSGDILARFHRMNGDDVLMVSGADSHGTKIELIAKKEGVKPQEVVQRYYQNFVKALDCFDFSFDKFSYTYSDFHKENVKKFFVKMWENGYLYEKVVKRPYCSKCGKFVADTEIEITCPVCGKTTKADNCDCGYVPNEKDIEKASCLVCGTTTELKENKVLVFKLTAFKDLLEKSLNENRDKWRANSVNETEKYLKDLVDRDFSRDLAWGVEMPIAGFEDKKVWVWWEALMGYVTDTMLIAEEKGFDWQRFWKTDVEPETEKLIYMCHAKDNIPFHSLFFPAMLASLNENFVVPGYMVSAEYLLMNNEKISKSKGGFEALTWAEKYNTDSLRYYFTVYGPEKKDCNFAEELFVNVHNTEVVNKIGNLVNRTLKFKGLEKLPNGVVDKEIKKLVENTYEQVAENIQKIEFKKAANLVMDLVSEANKYYDEKKPWVLAKEEDKTEFNNVIFTCAHIIANLGNLLEPFMPKTAKKIRDIFGNTNYCWKAMEIEGEISLEKIEPLFVRV